MKLILESWRNYVVEEKEEVNEDDLSLKDAVDAEEEGESDRKFMEEAEETIEGKRPPGMGKRTMKDLDEEAKTRETNFLKKKKDEKKRKSRTLESIWVEIAKKLELMMTATVFQTKLIKAQKTDLKNKSEVFRLAQRSSQRC